MLEIGGFVATVPILQKAATISRLYATSTLSITVAPSYVVFVDIRTDDRFFQKYNHIQPN